MDEDIYTSPEYYTRIFSRNHNPSDPVTEGHFHIAKENILLFDKIIIAETGMDALDELGWSNESDTKHATFGDRWAILFLLKKLRFWRLIQYIRAVKHKPSDEVDIEKLNKFDMRLYQFLNAL